jgi:hypothetical protein
MDVDPGVNLEHLEPDQNPRPETLEAPSLTTSIAHQTHILQKIADAVPPDLSREPFIKKFKEFYKLKPPTFDHANNPIEVDD